jgi:zinc protease
MGLKLKATLQLPTRLLVCLIHFLFSCIAAHAFEIQEVTSTKGIKAWLVEAHNIPIVTVQFSFAAARDFEVAGKEGSLGLLTNTLREGAGPYSAAGIKTKLADLTSAYGFYASADNTSGYLQSLSKNLDTTAELLKATLKNPSFEKLGLDRMRDDALQSLARGKTDQSTIADDAWFAKAFPNHLYGRNNRGTETSVNSITAEDLKVLWKRIANRRGLQVAVVGDISAPQLSKLLDHLFGELPDTDLTVGEKPVAIARGPIELRIEYDNPQTVIYFGTPAHGGDGRDGWASYLLAEILGGSANFARLNQSLREKSGLTYGVGLSHNDWEFADVQLGSFSTATSTTEQALALLRKELAEMAANGPTAEELRKIKSFINGSYPLNFTDNNSIAQELLSKKKRGYSPDYFKNRSSKVNAITLEEVKAVAAKLLQPQNQIIVVVGKK